MAADLGLSLLASAGILLSLAVITTLLRCIARIYVVKAFGIDDYFMIATLLLYTHYCAWVFYGRSLDQGRETVDIPIKDIPLALMAFYFGETTYILVTLTLKLSIGTFLLRIMRTKTQIYIIYAILLIITCCTTAIFFKSVFQCRPISHFWNRLDPTHPGTCDSDGLTLGLAYFHSSIIASSDFAFTLMPIFVVWRLQMDRFTKISVCSLMGLGAIAGITTLLRVPFLKELVSVENFFHATAELAILSSVEPGLGIIIGSAAATRPLFRLLFAKYHPFVSLTQVPPPTSKDSKFTGSSSRSTTTHRNSTRRDMEIGYPAPIPMEQFNINRGELDIERGDLDSEVGVKMAIEGGKVNRLCQTCTRLEERCGRCGTNMKNPSIHTIVERSSGDTFGDGEHGLGEGVIYKDVAVERVVEFLTKK